MIKVGGIQKTQVLWQAVSLAAPPPKFYSARLQYRQLRRLWRLMRGNIIKKRLMSFTFEKPPRISLSCKLVPVQYREYEYGLLFNFRTFDCVRLTKSLGQFDYGGSPNPIENNSPFPNCLKHLYQSEAWCTTIHMKMSLIYM